MCSSGNRTRSVRLVENTVPFNIRKFRKFKPGFLVKWNAPTLCIRICIDLPPVLSSLFQLHPDCGSHRKKCSTNMTGPHTHLSIRLHIKLPLRFLLPGFLDFFAFLTFSLSASLSSEYSSKLLLCCSSQDDCNAVAILH